MKGLKYLIELKEKVSGPAAKVKRAVGGALPGLDRLKAKMAGVNREGNKSGGLRKFGSNILRLGRNIAAATALSGVLSVAGLAAVGTQATNAAVEISNANRIIDFATAGKGAENIQFLDKTIRDLNLPLRETYQNFSEVAGSFKDTVLQGQPMRDIFEGVATASSAMSLGPAKSGRIFTALSQIMSKGKVSAEELTQQLGEALPGSLSIAARSMGLSKAAFYKLMEQGKIMSEDFLPAFAKELKKTFGPEAIKAAQMPQAAFVAFQNAIYRIKAALGEQLLPILAKLANYFAPLIEELAPKIGAVFDFAFSRINEMYNNAKPLLDALFSIWEQLRLPVMTFINVLYEVGNVIRGVLFETLASFLGAIDFGYILGGLFAALIPILQAIGKGFQTLKPLLVLLGRIAGVIVNFLGKLALKVVEKLAWAFVKVANGVTWVYDKIVGLLTAIGLLDKKKVSVDVGVNKPRDLFAGLRPGDQTGTGGVFGITGGGEDSVFAGGGSAGAGDAAGKAISSVSRGGSKPTNINVQLGSLISGGFTVQTTNLKEGAEKVEEVVMSALLKVLNGANQVVS